MPIVINMENLLLRLRRAVIAIAETSISSRTLAPEAAWTAASSVARPKELSWRIELMKKAGASATPLRIPPSRMLRTFSTWTWARMLAPKPKEVQTGLRGAPRVEPSPTPAWLSKIESCISQNLPCDDAHSAASAACSECWNCSGCGKLR